MKAMVSALFVAIAVAVSVVAVSAETMVSECSGHCVSVAMAEVNGE